MVGRKFLFSFSVLFSLSAYASIYTLGCRIFDTEANKQWQQREEEIFSLIYEQFPFLDEGDTASGRAYQVSVYRFQQKPTAEDFRYFVSELIPKHEEQVQFVKSLKGLNGDELKELLSLSKSIELRSAKEWNLQTESGTHLDGMKVVKALIGNISEHESTTNREDPNQPDTWIGKTFQSGRPIGLLAKDKSRGWRYDIDPSGRVHINAFKIDANGEKLVYALDLNISESQLMQHLQSFASRRSI